MITGRQFLGTDKSPDLGRGVMSPTFHGEGLKASLIPVVVFTGLKQTGSLILDKKIKSASRSAAGAT